MGDPVPVFAGGTVRSGTWLVATAIECLLDDALLAVVAHSSAWTEHSVRELRKELPKNGTRVVLVTEAEAAYTALRASREIPDGAAILLCDIGKSGMDVAVVSASDDDTVRVDQPTRSYEFCGDLVDSLLVAHILNELAVTHPGFDPADRRNWSGLRELRKQIAQAKHRLSQDVSAVMEVSLPGIHENLRIVRSELEDLIAEPVAQAVRRIVDAADNATHTGRTIQAVVLTGGSSTIPLLTETLSATTDVPIINSNDPGSTVVRGAALIAASLLARQPHANGTSRILPPGQPAPPPPLPAAIPPGGNASRPPAKISPRPAPTPPPAVAPPRKPNRMSRSVAWSVAVAATVLAILGGLVVGFEHVQPNPTQTAVTQTTGHSGTVGGRH
ncbi:Hsp70 family protein [Nocardia sp. NPDC051570]|uniref:Hsp70 family protein n=1 Tax=Nocardia sp. NPDC051570 TaxID=3364324 RepID=UPI003795E11E